MRRSTARAAGRTAAPGPVPGRGRAGPGHRRGRLSVDRQAHRATLASHGGSARGVHGFRPAARPPALPSGRSSPRGSASRPGAGRWPNTTSGSDRGCAGGSVRRTIRRSSRRSGVRARPPQGRPGPDGGGSLRSPGGADGVVARLPAFLPGTQGCRWFPCPQSAVDPPVTRHHELPDHKCRSCDDSGSWGVQCFRLAPVRAPRPWGCAQGGLPGGATRTSRTGELDLRRGTGPDLPPVGSRARNGHIKITHTSKGIS